jgi:hypothetical protein
MRLADDLASQQDGMLGLTSDAALADVKKVAETASYP